jgi:hypothetical protein
MCKFRKITLKPGIEMGKMQMYNYWVNTIATDNMEYIKVEWQDCDHFVEIEANGMVTAQRSKAK